MPDESLALQRHFAQQPCQVCQRRSVPAAVVTLARRQHTRVVLVTCGACHHRGIYVVAIPVRAPGAGVSRADVTAMRRFLTTFNGDFHGLFGGGATGRLGVE